MDSFSRKVKNELARLLPSAKCCQRAELAAIIRMDGTVEIHADRGMVLSVSTGNAAVARKVYKLMKKLMPVKVVISMRRETKLRKNNVYMLQVVAPSDEEVWEILEFKIHDDGYYILNHPDFLSRNCCWRAYLRGAFLGGGYVSNPEVTGTNHLEFITGNDFHTSLVERLMFNLGLQPKVGRRKNNKIVYLKESAQIIEFLNYIGAHSALLTYENVRIFKDVRNKVNRLVNCETANLNKTVNAAIEQVEFIQVIRDRQGLEFLPPTLREVAELRLEYPDASLQELGQMLTPKVGKSAVNHRMRRLKNIAEELKERKG